MEAEALANIKDVDMKRFVFPTSSPDLEFPERLCLTIGSSLIVRFFEIIAIALG